MQVDPEGHKLTGVVQSDGEIIWSRKDGDQKILVESVYGEIISRTVGIHENVAVVEGDVPEGSSGVLGGETSQVVEAVEASLQAEREADADSTSVITDSLTADEEAAFDQELQDLIHSYLDASEVGGEDTVESDYEGVERSPVEVEIVSVIDDTQDDVARLVEKYPESIPESAIEQAVVVYNGQHGLEDASPLSLDQFVAKELYTAQLEEQHMKGPCSVVKCWTCGKTL